MCYTREKNTRHTAARSPDVSNHTLDVTSCAHRVTSITLLPQELCDEDTPLKMATGTRDPIPDGYLLY